MWLLQKIFGSENCFYMCVAFCVLTAHLFGFYFWSCKKDIGKSLKELCQPVKWKSITKPSEKNIQKGPKQKIQKTHKKTAKKFHGTAHWKSYQHYHQELIRMRRWGHIVSFIYKGCQTCNSTLELDCRKKTEENQNCKIHETMTLKGNS